MASKLTLGSEQYTIVAISLVTTIVPVILVVLRIVSRRIANRLLNSSDHLIIPACCIIITSVYKTGMSYHLSDVIAGLGIQVVTDFLKILFSLQLLYTICISLTKMSILGLYRMIFPSTKMVVSCISMQAIIMMWALATIFVTLFLCHPIAFNWDTSIPGGKCGDTLASWKSTGIVNIITDGLLLVLPIPALVKVQMAVYKKVVIITTFTLGVFTTAVGIARLVSIVHVDQTDITYTVAWAIVFSALEGSVAVSLSCIPLLRPLLGGTKYSKNGTARSQSTKQTSRRHGPRSNKNAFQRMDDESSDLELSPHGGSNGVIGKADDKFDIEHTDDTKSDDIKVQRGCAIPSRQNRGTQSTDLVEQGPLTTGI